MSIHPLNAKTTARALEDIAAEINVKTLDDWKNVRVRQVLERGGNWIIKYYDGSLQNALKVLYPEHDWHFDSFRTKGYWISLDNQKKLPLFNNSIELYFNQLNDKFHNINLHIKQ